MVCVLVSNSAMHLRGLTARLLMHDHAAADDQESPDVPQTHVRLPPEFQHAADQMPNRSKTQPRCKVAT